MEVHGKRFSQHCNTYAYKQKKNKLNELKSDSRIKKHVRHRHYVYPSTCV